MRNFFKNRIVKSVLISLLAIGLITGGYVGARFSDQGSVQTTVTSGTFDLRVNGSDATQYFTISNMVPNDRKSFAFTLKNAGTTKGQIERIPLTFTQEGGVYTDAEARLGDATNAGNLGEFLQDEVRNGTTVVGSGSLSGPVGNKPSGTDVAVLSTPLEFNGGDQATLTIELIWPWKNDSYDDNRAQGDKMTVGATFQMVQVQA